MLICNLSSIHLVAVEIWERRVQSKWGRLQKEAAQFTGGLPAAIMNFGKMSSDFASLNRMREGPGRTPGSEAVELLGSVIISTRERQGCTVSGFVIF